MELGQVVTFGTAEADNDNLLLECFQDHEAYTAARAHEKFLIVGRKGSGKTAIFRKLVSETAETQFCHGHSFSDYPWFHHDKQKKTGVPDSECYRYSWEYIILISLARLILNEAESFWSDESLEAMARLESFFIDTYGTKAPELNRIFSPETSLKLEPSLTLGWGPVKAGITAKQIDMVNLPLIVYEVNQALTETIIRCLNPDLDYHICFDELDRGFSATDENYRLRLSGLIIAARDLNRRLKRSNCKASAIIFLRDDILRHLKFEDKNKIVEDSLAVIEWDKQTTSRSLKNIMEKRFSRVLNISTEHTWDIVFDETQQMPGRQSKYQHIIDRTFKRPRDIIKFCNEILRVYKLNGETIEKFQNYHIIKAREEQSKYMRKELVDEMHQYFSSHDFAFDVLRTIGYLSFTIEKFKDVFAELSERRSIVITYAETLRALYDFSAIGYLKVGGSGGGSEWVWRYEDTETEYDERATTFRVHSGLKEVFDLKQGRATRGEAVEQPEEEAEPPTPS
ncbi:hypothetical protein V5F29_07705 [Xanthobacter aminoxidans]|uniref:P-loop ATPase, Sll1717 family n=1 Tax=Xanthobacter aminoxidans TaxID=186280 RepID=UPI0037281705